jgi:hypothetical protein
VSERQIFHSPAGWIYARLLRYPLSSAHSIPDILPSDCSCTMIYPRALPLTIDAHDERVRGCYDSRLLLPRTRDHDLDSSNTVSRQFACDSTFQVGTLNGMVMRETYTEWIIVSISRPLPPDPPGFKPRLFFNTDKPLSPSAVYVTAIDLMHHLAKYPWDEVLQTSWATCDQGYDLLISLDTTPYLQNRYMVLSLHRSVLAMAEERPGFFSLTTLIMLDDKAIGAIEFSKAEEPCRETSTIGNGNSTAKSDSPVLHNSVIDPEDEKFIIQWEDTGANLPMQDILFAILDGLATVAQYGQDTPCHGIHGMSVKANAAFYFGPHYRETIPCGLIRRAFFLVAMQIVIEKKMYREKNFDLRFEGTLIGQGSLLKMGQLVDGRNGTGTLATS